MILLRWLIVIPFAMICGVVAAMLMLGMAMAVSPDFATLMHGSARMIMSLVINQGLSGVDPTPATLAVLSGMATVLATVLLVPVGLTAIVSEVFRLRSAMLQTTMAGVLAMMLPLAVIGLNRLPTGSEARVAGGLFLIGAVAGAVYWLIAGRKAGGQDQGELR